MKLPTKLNYRKKNFKCKVMADYIFQVLASRFEVPVPIVVMSLSHKKSQFKYPNVIILSAMLLESPLTMFIQNCIHEFAHYLQWHREPKKKAKMGVGGKSHGVEFYSWLILCCSAFFGKDWDGMEYMWDCEYPIIRKRAVRDGWLKERKK
jgi:tellurite resistance protein TehA-like permease